MKFLRTSDTAARMNLLWKEVEALRYLEHPHIVRFSHSFPVMKKCSVAIVMEYLSGGELR